MSYNHFENKILTGIDFFCNFVKFIYFVKVSIFF